MDKNNGFGFFLMFLGIILFLVGIVTDAGPDAYIKYNETKKGYPPRVQKIRLIGGGIIFITLGILIVLKVI